MERVNQLKHHPLAKKKSGFRLRYGKYIMNNIIGSIEYFKQFYELVNGVQLQQNSLVLILSGFFPQNSKLKAYNAYKHVYSAYNNVFCFISHISSSSENLNTWTPIWKFLILAPF